MRCLQYLLRHLHEEIHSSNSATSLVLARHKLTLDEGESYMVLLSQNIEVFWWLSAITYQANSVYILIQFPGATFATIFHVFFLSSLRLANYV
jgi:hypothetical protein